MKLEIKYTIIYKDNLYKIMQNNKQLKTPAGNNYSMKQEKLAKEIAKEWQSQKNKIIPSTMPLTQLMATALDIIKKDRKKIQKNLASYIPTELLCYKAQKPETLVEKQNTIWNEYLKWCENKFNISFKTSTGITPIEQKEKTISKITTAIKEYDDFALSALSCATDCTGSIVLGLALIEQFKPASDIFEACEIDVTDQAIRWGEDPVTKEKHKSMLFELNACEKWVELLKG